MDSLTIGYAGAAAFVALIFLRVPKAASMHSHQAEAAE